MISSKLLRLAFRARASSLVVATTGSTTLSATATGYARASGSFVDDGFVIGQDVTPTGFPQTDVGVITAVSASALTIDGGRTVAVAASGRTLVSGLPTLRAWQNIGTTPIAGRPFIVEALPFGGSTVLTIPGRTGRLQQDGLSVWTWYGVAGLGTSALDLGVTALMKQFAPYTHFALSDGTTIDMRGDIGPTASDVVTEGGFARVQVTLPWRTSTRNAGVVV